jgi:hypothetical protein
VPPARNSRADSGEVLLVVILGEIELSASISVMMVP